MEAASRRPDVVNRSPPREVPIRVSVRPFVYALAAAAGALALTVIDKPAGAESRNRPKRDPDAIIRENALAAIAQGRQAFRYDTFGDEAFWGDTLKVHQAIEGAALGG